MKLLLDTNFLIYVAKYKLFDKLRERNDELITLEQVIKELHKLSESGKEKLNSLLSLEIIKLWNIKILKIKEKNADNAIVKFSNINKKLRVATMDHELSGRLQKLGIKTLKIRQKRYFIDD